MRKEDTTMRHAYTKPTLEVIPFELNEAIASGCGLKVYNHTVASCSNDPTDEWQDIVTLTGATLTEDYDCKVPMYGYCYFTSNGTGTFLFNS